MNMIVRPAPLSGRIPAVDSKSAAHRLLICAALAGKTLDFVKISEWNDDLLATKGCLESLINSTDSIIVDCHESGSTLRFLLPVAATLARNREIKFIGSGRLPERDTSSLLTALKQHGMAFSSEKLPFTMTGTLSPGTFVLPGSESSQFVSGLLLALPLLAADSRVTLTSPLQSAAYVDMTISALNRFGITIIERKGGYEVPGNQEFNCTNDINGIVPEGDWSNAAFFLAAGAIRDTLIFVDGLDDDSVQGDRAIVGLLNAFPEVIDVSQIPDLAPILAVRAAFLDRETTFIGVKRLILKESNRLTATACLIDKLGARAEIGTDYLRVIGKSCLKGGGTVDGANDHRIVMAAAIGATFCENPIVITNSESVKKSYPRFWHDFALLGGDAQTEA